MTEGNGCPRRLRPSDLQNIPAISVPPGVPATGITVIEIFPEEGTLPAVVRTTTTQVELPSPTAPRPTITAFFASPAPEDLVPGVQTESISTEPLTVGSATTSGAAPAASAGGGTGGAGHASAHMPTFVMAGIVVAVVAM